MTNLYILKASGKLNAFESVIKTSIDECLTLAKEKISLPTIDIVVDDDKQSSIPEVGIGGYAPHANLLYIHIDTEYTHSEDGLRKEIMSTLAHELHHCARSASVGYGRTLLEAVVSEGLADHFDIEINGGEPKPWSVALRGEKLEEIMKKAEIEYNNESYNHSMWFYGSYDGTLPRWAGYSLGFTLVSEYIKKSSKKASELVNHKAQEFIHI